MSKPKFNKKKCLKCKFHGTGVGYPVRVKSKNGNWTTINVHCNYGAGQGGSSCLRPLNCQETYDLRGEDYDNCLLFKEVSEDEG